MISSPPAIPDPDDGQLPLIPPSELPDNFFCETRKGGEGEYTGELVRARDPQRYRLILTMLASGIGVLRIQEVTQCNPSTILAIRNANGGAIGILKEGIARLARNGAQLCIESIMEALADPITRSRINPRDLSVIAGILIDKAELLTGGATARIEFVPGTRGPTLADFNKLLDAAAATMPIDVECVEMGCERGTRGQKGSALAPAAGAVVEAVSGIEAGPAPGEERREDQGDAPGAGPAGGSV
jgi:hypothetical protein